MGLSHDPSENSLRGSGGLRSPVARQEGGSDQSGGEAGGQGGPTVGEDVSVRPPNSWEAEHSGHQPGLLLLLGLLALDRRPE